MLKIYLLCGLILAIALVSGCHSNAPQQTDSSITNETSTTTETPLPPPRENLPPTADVNFNGVTFTYNPQIFGEVKPEEVPESPLENETDKPDEVAPKHLLFTFNNPGQTESIIAVYPIEEYRRVWLPVEKNNTKSFDNDLNDVKNVIKNAAFRRNGEIPVLLFYDAHQTFNARVKQLSFQSGRGLFFLTQINQEYAFINNQQLTYIYQGISEDGKSYIFAEFPVIVSFLPENQEVSEFDGIKLPEQNDASLNKYKDYLSEITKRLENLPQNEFQPDLDSIEKIISTLQVKE